MDISNKGLIWKNKPPKGCPFRQSENFSGIEFTEKHAEYSGADTYYLSWASDGNLYSCFADGWAWNDGVNPDTDVTCTRVDEKPARTGQLKIVGDDPLDLKVLQLGFCVEFPGSNVLTQDGGPGRYPCGQLVYDDGNGPVWYYGTYILHCDNEKLELCTNYVGWTELGPFMGFRYSKDFGHYTASWDDGYWVPSPFKANGLDEPNGGGLFNEFVETQARVYCCGESQDRIRLIPGRRRFSLRGTNGNGKKVVVRKQEGIDIPLEIKVDESVFDVMILLGTDSFGNVSTSLNDVINAFRSNAFYRAEAEYPTSMNYSSAAKEGEAVFFGGSHDEEQIKIGAPHFVDFGKNMEHSPDGKAYLVAHGAVEPITGNTWIQGDKIYMVRVTPSVENINNPQAYEYFAGKDKDGADIWRQNTDNLSEIKPIAEWDRHLGCVNMTFNKPLNRYFMCVTRGMEPCHADLIILESDSITGPWNMVHYLRSFGEEGEFACIPSKFIAPDGKTMWLSWSANYSTDCVVSNPPGSGYQWCLREFYLHTCIKTKSGQD